jgi:hypothetical protein
MERYIEYERDISGNIMIPFLPYSSMDVVSSAYMGESKGSRYYPPSQRQLDASKGILVHNTLKMHTFTIHNVEIQAPNLKAAKKIYNRIKHTK